MRLAISVLKYFIQCLKTLYMIERRYIKQQLRGRLYHSTADIAFKVSVIKFCILPKLF